MEKINQILNNFSPISLDEMDKVSLLNRLDKKYLINAKLLPELMQLVINNYFILEIMQNRLFQYKTLYFDTEDLKMFFAHHNGKLNRYKIRKREYIETKDKFLEIKFKNNKGRTVKERVREESTINTFQYKSKVLIAQNTPFNPEKIEGQIFTNFKRLTLVNKNFSERITIDLELVFKNHTTEVSLQNIVVIEVKQDKYLYVSPLSDNLRNLKIHPTSFSKYCFGTLLLNPKIKQNNFKPKLLQLNKLNYA